MQNCRASSTNPTPPYRWSGFLEAHRCTGTHTKSAPLLIESYAETTNVGEMLLIYRYLFRKTPLKMMSIMLSISVLFSSSLKSTRKPVKKQNNRSDMIHSHRAQIQFFSTQPKWHWSYLCDLLLYSLQLQCAFLSHRLRPLHLIQFLSVLNADAQAQSHARQRAQQLHRLTGMSRARPHSTD